MALAGDVSTQDRRAELERLIKGLRLSPNDAGASGAGLSRQASVAGLSEFISRNRETDDAKTASLWLGVSFFDSAQGVATNKAEAMAIAGERFSTLAKGEAAAWQTKAARLMNIHWLWVMRRWPECRAEINNSIQSISQFSSETNGQYVAFLGASGASPATVEPEMRMILVSIDASEGRFTEALEQARFLQSKFPDFSKKNRLQVVISKLEKKEEPFHLPRL